MFLPPPFGAPLPVVPPFLPGFGSLQFDAGGSDAASSSASSTSQAAPPQLGRGTPSSLLMGDAYANLFRKELLGSYLLNNGAGERDVSAALVAAAAAAAASDASVPGPGPPPRLPPLSEPPSAPAEPGPPTADTFAEMLQRIGARIGKKTGDGGLLQPDLFRLNGLGAMAGRFPPPPAGGSLTSTPSSSTSSSRLVDRVVCDICNKEVCNKYFLKTHKMKVHGWDPNTSTVPTVSLPSTALPITAESAVVKSEPPSNSQPPPSPFMYFPSLPNVDKPSLGFPESGGVVPKDAELQKMGIDPEAYCEICRKEFCSKYFLRTHRQNIHGIQDASGGSPPGSYHGPSGPPLLGSTSQPFVLPPPPALPVVSLPSSLSAANCSTPSSGSMFLLSDADGPHHAAAAAESPRSSTWKWKEPVNATRVSCTLCNKVLCNKYFLRTHMAKRHGVTVDTRLLPPPAPPHLGQAVSQPPPPPLARDPVQPATIHPSTNGVLHQLAEGSPNVAEAETDGAKTAGGAVNLVLGGRPPADVQTVTARTWQVPADDSDPGGGDHPGAERPPTADDLSAVRCPLCATAVPDRDVVSHLTSVHHVDEQVSVSLAADPGPPGSPSPADLQRPPGSAGAMRRRRQFRCAFCRERFRTRVHCELHARAAHPRACGSSVEVTPAAADPADRASPPSVSCSLPAPVYATPLDAGDAARAQMLPYVLRESVAGDDADARFCTALVYLPTLRTLTSPTTVTFTLTPIMQP